MNHRPHSGLLVLVVALAVVAVSCSGDSAVCGQELTAGFQRIACEEMSFDVAVPEVCDIAGCGLIIDVHGRSTNGSFAERHTGMQGIGNAAGYVVVQPNSPQLSWNHETDDDRVRSFVDRLIEGLSLDRNRIHIGGFSQGGWMTWRFVCDHSDLIASAAPAGAGASDQIEPYPGVSCDFDADGSPAHQVDIFCTHGTQANDVLFETAIQQRDLVIGSWDMTQESVPADEGDYRWTRWTNAEGTVFEFLEHDWKGGGMGGHCYPGVSATIGCGTETPVHYGEAALQFYIDHPKSE